MIEDGVVVLSSHQDLFVVKLGQLVLQLVVQVLVWKVRVLSKVT
jgi:hypothetical protein